MKTNESSLTKRISEIQSKLVAPKNQFNSFGKYKYRNCEDVLEAVKKVLDGLILTISDEIVGVGDRVYVKATATISDGDSSVSVTAYAREPALRKGMDESQITGATSSYARKYALSGLLCIDDNKDADSSHAPEAKVEKVKDNGNGKNRTLITQSATVEGVCSISDKKIDKGDLVVFNTITGKMALQDEYAKYVKDKAEKEVSK